MKAISSFALKTAAAVGLSSLVIASAFADSRHQDETWRYSHQSYRNNERVSLEGSITHLEREREGYRLRLDRGGSWFYVPYSSMRQSPRGRDFRIGTVVQLSGVFRRGVVTVDSVSWPRAVHGRDRVAGVIERIDQRRDIVWIRDRGSRHLIEVDLRLRRRWSRNDDIRDLRRGDYVSLSGEWLRNRRFEAHRIDNVRSARY